MPTVTRWLAIPYGLAEDGTRIDFDVVTSGSSIVSRVTGGQILEPEADTYAQSVGRAVPMSEYYAHLKSLGLPKYYTTPTRVIVRSHTEPIYRLGNSGSPMCDVLQIGAYNPNHKRRLRLLDVLEVDLYRLATWKLKPSVLRD